MTEHRRLYGEVDLSQNPRWSGLYLIVWSKQAGDCISLAASMLLRKCMPLLDLGNFCYFGCDSAAVPCSFRYRSDCRNRHAF